MIENDDITTRKPVSNWSYNAPVRPVFRILGGFLAVVMFGWVLFVVISDGGIRRDNVKIIIPQLFLGIISLASAIFGRIPTWMINDRL